MRILSLLGAVCLLPTLASGQPELMEINGVLQPIGDEGGRRRRSKPSHLLTCSLKSANRRPCIACPAG